MATRTEKHILSRRKARWVGFFGFVFAAVLPALMWRRSIEAIASDFRFEAEYLVTGWTGYALIGLGLLFFVPVLVSIAARKAASTRAGATPTPAGAWAYTCSALSWPARWPR